jgi:hypothetical protein
MAAETAVSIVFAAMEFLPLPLALLVLYKRKTPGGGSERLGISVRN